MKTKPLAVLVSDIHLSHVAPSYRKLEPDWYEAMARPLTALRKVVEYYEVPCICAGDVFHKWNSPPKLINFAIENLPEDFDAIPGQHDLPHHRLEDIKDSAFYTLMNDRSSANNKKMKVHHFPWGAAGGEGMVNPNDTRIQIAVLHRFVNCPTAPLFQMGVESNPTHIQKEFSEFDLVVTGDHHHHFSFPSDGKSPTIINVGQLLCRNRGESRNPNIVLLYDDLSFVNMGDHDSLDIFDDECYENDSTEKTAVDLGPLLKGLDSLVLETKNLDDIIKMLSNSKSRSSASIQLIRSLLDERQ